MYPRNVGQIRVATADEGALLKELKAVGEEWDAVNSRYMALENQVKACIGEADGLIHGGWKVTWKRDRDSVGTDWEAVARGLCETDEDQAALARLRSSASCQKITRTGARKMHASWGKKK